MSDPREIRAGRRLFLVVMLAAVVWLVVLPWLTRLPFHQRYLKQLQRRGIDPSAMYYTELPEDLFLDHLPAYQTPRRH